MAADIGDDREILDILMAPAPRDVDGGADGDIPDGALAQFNAGFSDGWHGRAKKSRNGIYTRAYANGRRAKTESDYFLK